MLKTMGVKYQNGHAVCIPEYKPVAFNPWKHHRNYVCSQIEQNRRKDETDFSQYLNYIGGTLLDFYLGNLTVEGIINEVNLHFRNNGVNNADTFKHWLGLPAKAFRSIILSDGSRWVMRLGQNDEFYIHIHPGRYSPLTVRCRPTTLKVAIAYRYLFGFERDDLDVVKINRARKFADLPPVNTLDSVTAILKFIPILRVNNC